jgi:hypothetical protein
MDKIFKIGLLVLGFSYLAYLFCPIANQTGRYQYYTDSDSKSVFDTSTGLLYSYASRVGGSELDIITWAKDDIRIKKGYQEMELQETIERIRKEGIEIEETN